jgi:hypothetical protein
MKHKALYDRFVEIINPENAIARLNYETIMRSPFLNFRVTTRSLIP